MIILLSVSSPWLPSFPCSLVHICPHMQQQYNECLGELSPRTGLPIHCQIESKPHCALCVQRASKQLSTPLPIELAGTATTELPNAANSRPAPTAYRHHWRERSQRDPRAPSRSAHQSVTRRLQSLCPVVPRQASIWVHDLLAHP